MLLRHQTPDHGVAQKPWPLVVRDEGSLLLPKGCRLRLGAGDPEKREPDVPKITGPLVHHGHRCSRFRRRGVLQQRFIV